MKYLRLIVLLTIPLNFSFNTMCQCGSFADGITQYEVVEGSGGCCSGEASGLGMYDNNAISISYVRNEGAWEVDDIKLIEPSSAQNSCCDRNPV